MPSATPLTARKKPNAALAFGFFGSQLRYFNFFRGNYWPR